MSPSDAHIVTIGSDWLATALRTPDGDVVLTSPYLTVEICRQVAEAARGSARSWVLVTSLDPSAVANGYLSIQGLQRLLDAGVEVRHVERLHAKCFVVGTRGLVGSANLTGAGLGSSARPNRELGVELSSAQAAEARNIISTWPARHVSVEDLHDLRSISENLTNTQHEQHQTLDDTTTLRLAEAILVDARHPSRTLWLKLEYGEPGIDKWRGRNWIASPKKRDPPKGKPSFRPGDLVFICAQETKDCYAVVEVDSAPEYQPEDYVEWSDAEYPGGSDRWPWINRTVPRLVPASLVGLRLAELGKSGRGLQNGHVRLDFDQFTAGVRALARLASQ